MLTNIQHFRSVTSVHSRDAFEIETRSEANSVVKVQYKYPRFLARSKFNTRFPTHRRLPSFLLSRIETFVGPNMSSTKSIAIITGSTRTPRVGPLVAGFVQKIIQDKADLQGVSLESVDLAEFKLPVYDETSVPAMIAEPDQYANEHSRRWAKEISRHDGYILVSPEYNYGMPGGVKNAIDYLYHPWKGKPVAIVTYGLDGGKTASAQLENTLSRMGLQVCSLIDPASIYSKSANVVFSKQVAAIKPQLPFKGGGTGADTGSAMMKGELGKDSSDEWKQTASDDVIKAFEEVKAAVLNPYTQDKKD